MIRSCNLRIIIFSLIAVFGIALGGMRLMPDLAVHVKEMASLLIGGLLAIMRPSSTHTEPKP